MAVTLNLKASKNFFELFPSVGMNWAPSIRTMLKDAEIYYQTHCFDVLVKVEANKFHIARFETQHTGALMQGLLGNKPMLELSKSVAFTIKHFANKLTNNDSYSAGVFSVAANACTMQHSTVEGYAKFLEYMGDSKACPAAHKPKVQTTPKPQGLDFNKLEAAVAETPEGNQKPLVEEGNQGEVASVSMGHGIYKEAVVYKKAKHDEHKNVGAVHLTVVEALGQRTVGTNPTSIYYVCGLNSLLNAAYRMKGDTFSFRVAAPKGVTLTKTAPMVERIIGCGLDVHYDGEKFDYASLHFSGMNYKSSRRVLGAMLADLDIFSPHECSLEIRES